MLYHETTLTKIPGDTDYNRAFHRPESRFGMILNFVLLHCITFTSTKQLLSCFVILNMYFRLTYWCICL